MVIRHYGETDFITGLRAIAAFMVVAIHTGAFSELGEIGRNMTDNGKHGVQIFFVISGFTIAATYRQAASFKQYFTRRVFRIAPLYYLVTGVAFVLIAAGVISHPYWMTLYGSQPDAYNALMHISFLSAWDARVANSLIGTEWTIPIEMFWYLLLPAMLKWTQERKPFLIAVALLLVLAGLTRAAGHLWLPPHAAHFMPLTYGPYFLIGAACLTWREALTDGPEHIRRRVVMAGWGLFAVGVATDTGMTSAMLGAATACLIVAIRAPQGGARFLTSRAMLYLGSISYSIYLWHVMVIIAIRIFAPGVFPSSGLVWFLVVSVLTVAVSTVTYLLVERPSNQWGKNLAQRMAYAA